MNSGHSRPPAAAAGGAWSMTGFADRNRCLTASSLARPEALQTWERLSSAVLTGWIGRPELAAVLEALDLEPA